MKDNVKQVPRAARRGRRAVANRATGRLPAKDVRVPLDAKLPPSPADADEASRYATASLIAGVNRDLIERVKELNCLYGISRLVENSHVSLDETLQQIVELIPPAWQYPEVTCARITYKRRQFKTASFRATVWKQMEMIRVDGQRCGTLEVCYLEPRAVCDEGPFLAEERNLIHAIAERLGHIIEREIAGQRVQSLYRQEKELREKLQAEMQGRVDFTRKMIHELKTPLTSLMATSQLLMDETRDTRLGKLAGYVWEGAYRLNSRIEELHDVIRGEIGKLELKSKPLDLGTLLRSVADEMAALARQHGMSIDVEIEEGLPQVQADPERVRQVMFNLINNAFKYAREGKKVRVRATRTLKSVVVEVRDYGPGITPDRQSRLFDPRYQLSSHETQTGGLGIGLALCKILVELSGGRIWLKSRAGRGCSFFFSLPVVK